MIPPGGEWSHVDRQAEYVSARQGPLQRRAPVPGMHFQTRVHLGRTRRPRREWDCEARQPIRPERTGGSQCECRTHPAAFQPNLDRRHGKARQRRGGAGAALPLHRREPANEVWRERDGARMRVGHQHCLPAHRRARAGAGRPTAARSTARCSGTRTTALGAVRRRSGPGNARLPSSRRRPAARSAWDPAGVGRSCNCQREWREEVGFAITSPDRKHPGPPDLAPITRCHRRTENRRHSAGEVALRDDADLGRTRKVAQTRARCGPAAIRRLRREGVTHITREPHWPAAKPAENCACGAYPRMESACLWPAASNEGSRRPLWRRSPLILRGQSASFDLGSSAEHPACGHCAALSVSNGLCLSLSPV